MFEEDVQSRRARSRSTRARCPACNAWVELKESVEQWDLVTCPKCGVELEVVQIKPPQLDYLSDGVWQEDEWEDDDWE